MKNRKELQEAYKHMKPTMGVFQIKNKMNGKLLIEGSTDIFSKWNRHRTELRFGSHRNLPLQRDWKNLGEENFLFSILSELEIKEEETLDPKTEVKLLTEMVQEELNIKEEMKY